GVGGKGVMKDFLSRWQRMAEAGVPVSETDRLQEELEHFDRLLETDATLERAWASRAKILEKLGRRDEALESLSKAADLNPATEKQQPGEGQTPRRATAAPPTVPTR